MINIKVLAVFFISFLTISCSMNEEKEEVTRIEKKPFGTLSNGEKVKMYTLRNTKGMEVDIMTYGGTIVRWTAPDKNGNNADVVLGMDSLQGYLDGVPYFGALVGRYGNRIAKGTFNLSGETYNLPINNGENALHGGLKGFDKVNWKVESFDISQSKLLLSYLSKDGEEGYPGNLNVQVAYDLKDDNSLSISYEATTDKATIVNLTNHTYFNLNGLGNSIEDHDLLLAADKFLPVDKGLIPTGELMNVEGTPMDFTSTKRIGKEINDSTFSQIQIGGGYDHCWVFTDQSNDLKSVAKVVESNTGRVMEVLTTEPGVQFYTGNFLNGSVIGKGQTVYGKRSGFCLETQHFPDSPNQESFPSTTLNPGETYKTTTVYKFSVK